MGVSEELAARTIQRAYRYYRVRGHFRSIVQLARARDNKPNVLRGRPSLAVINMRLSGASSDGVPESPMHLGRTMSIAVSATERDLVAGIYEFNYKPEKGIAMLVESGVIENNELAVAEFLATEKRLNKAKVGDFLGTGNPFTDAVIDAFVGKIDFSGLEFDMALRKFLSDSNFRLPGEAQKIARLVEAFGHYYVEANAGRSELANEGGLPPHALFASSGPSEGGVGVGGGSRHRKRATVADDLVRTPHVGAGSTTRARSRRQRLRTCWRTRSLCSTRTPTTPTSSAE